ncbi:MAG: BamA/TamA family outer membrane protein, partial [Bacteroidota bacterium]
SIDPWITPHYAYCQLHGFNPTGYVSSGLSLNFVYDTRDNLINPYKGYYVTVNYRVNQTWLGSTKDGSQLWVEFRTYVGLEKKMPRHLLAFWLYGGFQVSGEIPYFDLWATGFDQMNSSGRGYIQGRWRGENLVYGEMEYRFPISRCSQVLGGVIFTNVSTASSRDQGVPLFKFLRPAAGFGLRIMASKKSRTNIVIDFTIGEQMPGLYFSAQEAF